MESGTKRLKPPLLEMKGVSSRYGSVRALRNLNLVIHAGEIHALVGEHGAGKSTIAKIAANLLKPSDGLVLFDGKALPGKSIKGSMDAGIRMVFQKLQLNDGISVADNLFLNNKAFFQSPFQLYNHKRIEKLAEDFFRKNGIDLNPASKVSRLELADKALLAIVRNLYIPPKLLILDETLEKLSARSLALVIRWIKDLRDKGAAVLFISHRIDDLYMIADRVSIVRRGEVLLSENIAELDKISLIKLAYTQFNSLEKQDRRAGEFNRLLKYNEAVLRELPIGLIVFNNEERIRLMNKNAEVLFGYADCPQIGMNELLEGNEDILAAVRRQEDSSRMQSLNHVPLRIQGHSRICDIIIHPIVEDQCLIGRMLILEDVTEREQLREQLVLSEKLAGIGLLASGIAHEINNPLGVICNYLESFRQEKIPDEKRNEVIDRLFDQVDYISHVIGNLISFSHSRAELSDQVELHHEIEEIIKLIRYNGQKKGIEIRFESAPPPLQARINKNDLKQILLNLFKNSFEALSDGGLITLHLYVHEDGSSLCLLFQDDGPGIQFDDPNDIFLPFKSSKSKSGNFGLGLPLCFTLLKKYAGTISVENTLPRGCAFKILLPGG